MNCLNGLNSPSAIWSVVAIVLIMISDNSFSAEDGSILPEGFEVVNFSGGWRRGGSDPTKECLSYLHSNYPGKRYQILSKGEEGRWTGWHGRDREYRYWCTAIVQKN